MPCQANEGIVRTACKRKTLKSIIWSQIGSEKSLDCIGTVHHASSLEQLGLKQRLNAVKRTQGK